MQSSTILHIGTALNRAHDHDAIVEVLVEGQWLTGVVAGVDGTLGVDITRTGAASVAGVPGRAADTDCGRPTSSLTACAEGWCRSATASSGSTTGTTSIADGHDRASASA